MNRLFAQPSARRWTVIDADAVLKIPIDPSVNSSLQCSGSTPLTSARYGSAITLIYIIFITGLNLQMLLQAIKLIQTIKILKCPNDTVSTRVV
jgi:hypothetical protein